MLQTREITARDLDENEALGAAESHYSDKPIDPKDIKLVINETVIQQTMRTPLDIQKWRDAHLTADSPYYPNRSWLYDMYDDCSLDGHYTGIIAKRYDTVLNKPLFFKKDGKPDPTFTKLINGIAFRNVCRAILESQEWGISGIEFVPGREFTPRMIPRKHIKTKWQVISFLQTGKDGIDYTTAKNIWVIGDPQNLGFLLKCIPYIIYKRNAFGAWAQYIEIFGQPIRVMYYDANDRQAKIELKQTLDESGGSLALMIPKGVDFNIEDGKVTNGDGKLQQNFVDTINRELSVIVLGNTETTTNGQTGTGAKSKVHKDQQDEISKSDIKFLESYLNSEQFLQILQSYGYDVTGGSFEHDQEISIEYLTELIKILTQLPEDLPIDDDYWYKTFGIPKPENYAALKKQLQDKQKALMGVDDIASDPDNIPAKKPARPGGGKPKKEMRHTPTYPTQGVMKRSRFTLLRRLIDFFAQAR